MTPNDTDQAEVMEDYKVVPANMELIYQQDSALIDMQIATANKYPRNEIEVTQDAILDATFDLPTALSCNYSLPRAGKILTGESVHLAVIVAQNWKNLKSGTRVVTIGETEVTAQAICYDLQKNSSMTIEASRSIMQNEYVRGLRTGKMVRMSQDMIDKTGAAAASIALRNAIFKVIPKRIVRTVYNAAIEVITGDVSTPEKLTSRVNEVYKMFHDEHKVSEAEILKVIGKKSKPLTDKKDLVVLLGIKQSIQDNFTTAEATFKPVKKDPKTEALADEKKTQAEQLTTLRKELRSLSKYLSQADKDAIDRVIKNKIVNSYAKMINVLAKTRKENIKPKK